MVFIFYWTPDFKKLNSNAKLKYGWYPLSFSVVTISVGFCVGGSDSCKVVVIVDIVDGGDETFRTVKNYFIFIT